MRAYLLLVALATLAACSEDKDEIAMLEPIPTPIVTPAPLGAKEKCEQRRQEINLDCSSLKFNDGRGGLLVKQSDNRPQLAVVLPGTWQGAASVKAVKTNGTVEELLFAGCANPEANDAYRQHFRGKVNEPCTNYTGVVTVSDVGKSCELKVPKTACDRND